MWVRMMTCSVLRFKLRMGMCTFLVDVTSWTMQISKSVSGIRLTEIHKNEGVNANNKNNKNLVKNET
jgi:hypothetical protein